MQCLNSFRVLKAVHTACYTNTTLFGMVHSFALYHSQRGFDPRYKVHRPTLNFQKKHWNQKFIKERRDKVQPIELIDFHEKFDELTPAEMRMKMKQRGVHAHRQWQERPLYIGSTPSTFEPYIPPESDGKLSIITKDGAKQKLEFMTKKGRAYLAVRKINQFDDDFDIKEFGAQAQDIYIRAHKALADEDEDKLHELVTERAYPLMTHETKYKTIRWQFVESLEPPRVVHVRYTDIITKENIFAQITVRMHTKQTLAVYDRFGRLMHGSEVVAKDALEYVVFEKHLANEYGLWRIHDKIIPDWAPRPPSIARTYRLPAEEPEPVEEQETPAPESNATSTGPAEAYA